MFSIIMVLIPIFEKIKRPIIPKITIILLLSIQVYSGTQRQLLVDDRSTTTNPYLMVSEYQYIWTILIPAFWILVFLLSPNIKRFYETSSQKSN